MAGGSSGRGNMRKIMRNKSQTAAPVSEKAFRCAVLTLLIASVLLHLLAVYWATPFLWGVHFLHFFPGWLAWALTAAVLSFFIPGVNRRMLRLLESVLGAVGGYLVGLNRYLLFALAGLVSIPLFWALRTKLFLLGDGYFKLEALSEGMITFTEPLDGIIHQQLYQLLISSFPHADLSLTYTIPSVVCGGVFVFLLLVLSRLLGKTGFQQVLIFSALFTLGSIQLFMGYVETYTTLLVGLTLFLLLSLLCIRRKVNPILPFLPLAFSIAIHVSGVVLLPAFVYVVLWRWKDDRRTVPDAFSLLSLAGCSLIIFLAVWKVFLMPGEGNAFGQFVPIVSSTGYRFTMFCGTHLGEFFNQLLLLSPPGIILFGFFLFHFLRRRFFGDPILNFLLISSLAGLVLAFVYNSRWGNADWDLRAFPGIFFTLFGFLLLVRWGGGWARFKNYGLILIAVSLYHTVPWVLLNADTQMSLDRYTLTAVTDKHILSAPSGGLWTVGRVLDKAGRWAEAEDIYRRGLESNPGIVVYYSALANNLYAQQRYDEAISYLHTGLELEPESKEVRLSLARNHLKKEELTKAIPYLESLLGELDDDRVFVLTLSKTYMNLNRWADAREVLQRYLDQKQESAEMLGLLGLCFYMLRDDTTAERNWERALQLDSTETNAVAGLKRLEQNR
jgi:Tfp pilus assembly protein PilF